MCVRSPKKESFDGAASGDKISRKIQKLQSVKYIDGNYFKEIIFKLIPMDGKI